MFDDDRTKKLSVFEIRVYLQHVLRMFSTMFFDSFKEISSFLHHPIIFSFIQYYFCTKVNSNIITTCLLVYSLTKISHANMYFVALHLLVKSFLVFAYWTESRYCLSKNCCHLAICQLCCCKWMFGLHVVDSPLISLGIGSMSIRSLFV